MKHLLLIITLIFSMSSFAQKTKKEVKPHTMKPKVDFEPKQMAFHVKKLKDKNVFPVTIVVNNNANKDRQFKVIFYEYHPDKYGINDYKKSKANIKVPELSLNEYIEYDAKPFMVAKNSKHKYLFHIKMPKELKGTKYSYYTVEEVEFENYVEELKYRKKGGIDMELKYMSPLMVDIPGSGVKKVDFSMNYKNETRNINFIVKNIGDHYLYVPVVNVVLLDSNNKFIERITPQMPFLSTIKNLHPGREFPFVYKFSKELKPGKYRVVASLVADEGVFTENKEFELIIPEKKKR